jgi:hypothetical protein
MCRSGSFIQGGEGGGMSRSVSARERMFANELVGLFACMSRVALHALVVSK